MEQITIRVQEDDSQYREYKVPAKKLVSPKGFEEYTFYVNKGGFDFENLKQVYYNITEKETGAKVASCLMEEDAQGMLEYKLKEIGYNAFIKGIEGFIQSLKSSQKMTYCDN